MKQILVYHMDQIALKLVVTISLLIAFLVVYAHLNTHEGGRSYLQFALLLSVLSFYFACVLVKLKSLKKSAVESTDPVVWLHKYFFWKHKILLNNTSEALNIINPLSPPKNLRVSIKRLANSQQTAETYPSDEAVIVQIGLYHVWFTPEQWRDHFFRLSRNSDVILCDGSEILDEKPLSSHYFYLRLIGISLVGLAAYLIMVLNLEKTKSMLEILKDTNWFSLLFFPVAIATTTAHKLDKSYRLALNRLQEAPQVHSQNPIDAFDAHLNALRKGTDQT